MPWIDNLEPDKIIKPEPISNTQYAIKEVCRTLIAWVVLYAVIYVVFQK